MSVSTFNPLGRSRSLRTSTASSNLKLTSSSSAQPPAGPSYVTLFITNLRLLDLDLRDDWPDITVVTFSTKDAQQNQKKRIQGVEWALFQLFAIWDPEETRNVYFYYTLLVSGEFRKLIYIYRNYNHIFHLSNLSSPLICAQRYFDVSTKPRRMELLGEIQCLGRQC